MTDRSKGRRDADASHDGGGHTYVTHADLGGTLGHGPVVNEPEGEYFHAPWEARALALTVASGAPRRWNLDMSRRTRETLPDYSALSYYEIWIAALERLLVDREMISASELATGRADGPADTGGTAVLTVDRVDAVLRAGGPTARDVDTAPRFTVGQRVVTDPSYRDHHTRLPRYVAGATGTIARVHDAHVFPDSNAHGLGEQPQWLYTVVFEAADLWPADGVDHHVSVDAWESYLEPA